MQLKTRTATRLLILAGLALVVHGDEASAGQSPATHAGFCDASAAVALPGGSFVVADDESNELSVYSFDHHAARWTSPSLSKSLGAATKKNGSYREADLEGAARIDDCIYWVGSHGRSGKKGKARPTRHRLFCTRLSDDPLHPLATPEGYYETLLADATKDADPHRLRLAGLKHPYKGGANIEGLAATGNGGLLLGFRSPLSAEKKAILLELTNPAQAVSGGTATFGRWTTLELAGRGIRSIERRPGGDYLVVAGPVGDDVAPFTLYEWSGNADDAPKKKEDFVAHPPLAAEAVFVDGTGTVHVVSDDGDLAPGGKCEHADVSERTFRRIRLD